METENTHTMCENHLASSTQKMHVEHIATHSFIDKDIAHTTWGNIKFQGLKKYIKCVKCPCLSTQKIHMEHATAFSFMNTENIHAMSSYS